MAVAGSVLLTVAAACLSVGLYAWSRRAARRPSLRGWELRPETLVAYLVFAVVLATLAVERVGVAAGLLVYPGAVGVLLLCVGRARLGELLPLARSPLRR